MSWSLNASGSAPPVPPPADPAASEAMDAVAIEVALYEELRAVLSKPEYGTAASSFGGSHVSGSLHVADA
jgi:hypothetical protein